MKPNFGTSLDPFASGESMFPELVPMSTMAASTASASRTLSPTSGHTLKGFQATSRRTVPPAQYVVLEPLPVKNGVRATNPKSDSPARTTPPALNAVHQMDCLEGMKRMAAGSVNVIITSPPYNIGLAYDAYEDTKDRDEYLAWLGGIFHEAKRVLTDEGSLFLNVGHNNRDPWIAMDVAHELRKNWKLQNTLHWIKSISVEAEDLPAKNKGRMPDGFSMGHYKPLNSERYINQCHEYIFHFTKTGNVALDKKAAGVPYEDKSNIRRRGHNDDKRDRGNTWYIPYKTVNGSRGHPCVFPDKLPELCLRLAGYSKKTVVLDPFSGTGTTVSVAKKLGCHYIGFDIDPKYVEMTRKRLRQSTL